MNDIKAMKDCILYKWRGKLSYPFNYKDLEELERIIDFYEDNNKQLQEQLETAVNEIREYATKEKEFNDNQIQEYKTCIETNLNGKFNDEEKENMEHCMTVNICINYKMDDILEIIDKVLGDEK